MATTMVDWKRKLALAAGRLQSSEQYLSKIDGETGDGDHGVSIGKIAGLMKVAAESDAVTSEQLFGDLSWKITNVQGGSVGPLWGTFFEGFETAFGEDPEANVFAVYCSGLESLQMISRARCGDKTLMDALIPAVESLHAENDDNTNLQKAAEAAEKGAQATRDMVAKFGRAKNYGEATIGHLDPGACSMAILLRAFAED